MRSSTLEQIYPLTPLQSGLYFHARVADRAADVYTAQLTLDLSGPLDTALLRRACAVVVARHQALRAGFRGRPDGDPIQFVVRGADAPWSEEDLSDLNENSRAARRRALLATERARPFDLARPPLLRFLLIRNGGSEHTLVLTNHHLVLDGWSYPLLVQEVFHAYSQKGDVGALPSAAPYLAYHQWLGSQDTDTALAAWQAALSGVEPGLVAPDLAGVVVPERPETVTVRIPAGPTAALGEIARNCQTTLNTVVQGIWALFLARLTNSEEVVLGTVVSGRSPDLPGVQSLVGLLANTVPLPVRLQADEPLRDYFARLHQVQADLLPHHHADLAALQRALARPTLFDTVIAFENYPVNAAAGDELAPGLRLVNADIQDSTHYPLSLTVVPGTSMELRLTHRPGFLSADDMDTWARRLVRMATVVAEGTARTVAEVDGLSAEERAQLVAAGDGETRPVPPGTLADEFERQVARTPDAVALQFSAQQVTYRELNSRANRLARKLVEAGAGVGRRVALLLPRSADLVVALVAVLKSGAAYVPMDPGLPAHRIRFMMEDAAPTVVIATEGADRTPWGGAAAVLAVPGVPDGFTAAVAGRSDADLSGEAPVTSRAADEAASIIYTSGSTGRPKGVVASHRAVLNRIAWYTTEFGFRPDETMVAKTTLSFVDGSMELLSALIAGARLALVDDATARSASALVDLIGQLGENRITVVPSLLRAILDDADSRDADLTSCRLWISSGEALPADLVARFTRLLPGSRLVNFYGASEACADSLFSVCDAQTDVALGHPIWNTRALVLDSWRRLLPDGVTGELYLAGAGLAEGYLGQPSLTAERFLDCPFSPGGERMYRTGDLVRRRADGSLEYHGRADRQVKIRGVRVEPGEVEAVLGAHPLVGHAVVVDQLDQHGERRLVAFVTAADDGPDPVPSELRDAVRRQLPEHMVPSMVVPVDAIPMTPSGKIDRDALPTADFGALSRGRAPRGRTEEVLCRVFARVLGLGQVTAEDSFFDLGGHSLLATRLVSRIRAELGVEVDLRTVFEAPTTAQLALRLESGSGRVRPTLRPENRPEVIPLSPVQQRLWFLNRLHGSRGGESLSAAIRLDGELNVAALELALNDLVAGHESLRTVYPDWDGTPQQIVLDPEESPVELPVTAVTEQELTAELASASRKPFDLTFDSPLTAHLFRIGARRHVLLLTVHHIACDGWSLVPLARDTAAAYAARSAGDAPAVPALTVQYADYTLWHRRLLGDPADPDSETSRQVRFWQRELAGLPEQWPPGRLSSELPLGVTVRTRIGAVAGSALRGLARDAGVSPFMVFHAALLAVLTGSGHGTDLAVGTAVAGRTDDALEHLVGFFVNTLVLRTDTSGDPTFRELLGRVSSTDTAAYAHQDVPFDHLVQALNPARDIGRIPFFQVMLAFQNNRAPAIRLPGLTVDLGNVPDDFARFPVRFEVIDQPQAGAHQGEVDINLTYAVDLVSAGTAQELLGRYARVLESVARNPELRLSEVTESAVA
ncbi:non-ribosomal peptide synthetase [Streptomyces sp. NBC_01244]|uniref:non-ribosomal peptide synthetase n=1 Tax=Streptomyces sp. NBC_01244 TaxID=2903797 RepID=UPI002E0F0EEF|nr:non-ribosomal peptide synthetase [Streptomyces sp. NBC_01244]WSP41568.1 amino acid adenylation domain-containing protein [Streptomyces sp. NBC_01244]